MFTCDKKEQNILVRWSELDRNILPRAELALFVRFSSVLEDDRFVVVVLLLVLRFFLG